MTATDRDIHALAHIAVRLRQDTTGCGPWDLDGTTKVFLASLKGKHLATATELVLTHAQDPEARTPAAVTRPFTPTAIGTPVEPRCLKHPSQYAATCGQCEAEDRYAHGASDQARAHGVAACKAAIDASRHTPAEEDQ